MRILIFLILLSAVVSAQNDTIVFINGEKLACQITKIYPEHLSYKIVSESPYYNTEPMKRVARYYYKGAWKRIRPTRQEKSPTLNVNMELSSKDRLKRAGNQGIWAHAFYIGGGVLTYFGAKDRNNSMITAGTVCMSVGICFNISAWGNVRMAGMQ